TAFNTAARHNGRTQVTRVHQQARCVDVNSCAFDDSGRAGVEDEHITLTDDGSGFLFAIGFDGVVNGMLAHQRTNSPAEHANVTGDYGARTCALNGCNAKADASGSHVGAGNVGGAKIPSHLTIERRAHSLGIAELNSHLRLLEQNVFGQLVDGWVTWPVSSRHRHDVQWPFRGPRPRWPIRRRVPCPCWQCSGSTRCP